MHSGFFLKAVCCLNMNSQNVKCKDEEDYLEYTMHLETGKKSKIVPEKAIESFYNKNAERKKCLGLWPEAMSI